ncbi:uncharacterized protein LOC131876475 [Cryptomeria japonica]|uniref:uncharacterized protein LOC131876475 n=1 Tax=Cryptomeria japonica TaxID=3369 RepID=UPI0027DA0948|nr:uncharacterized protein LOC131876475 [Cryptomeria japonica]
MVKVISKTVNFSCFLVNVYGPTLAIEKCRLWEEVSRRLEEVRPLLAIVAGDFNATLSSSEKRGGVRRLSQSHLDFQSFVNDNALLEVVAKGGGFTWTNRRRGSNHFLVSLVVQNDVVPIRCPFKMEKMWFREPSFKELVVGWWKEAPVVEGFLAYQFFKKLSYVKQNSKSWNREVFGNIFDEKRRLEGDLGALNAKVMADGMDEVDFLTKKDLLSRLEDGSVVEDPDSIGKEVVSFFENLWKKNGIAQLGVQVELLELIPPLVSREDNSMLEEPVSLKEVKAAVFGLGGEKAPGPNGFQAFFFQSF